MVWDSYYLKYVAFSPVDDDYILNPGEAFFIQRPTAGDGKLVFREGGRQTYRNPNDLTARLKTLHYNDRVTAVFLTTVVYHGRSYLAKRNVTLTVR